ncbi:hypothetical protein SRHO_G00269140 [Serrasalmus rhombeus]
MNMFTKSAEPECRGPRMNSGQWQPPIRAFMDDLTVMTESVSGCQWILKGLEKLMEAREVVQYSDSSDPKVAKAGIQVRTGRKWRVEEAVQEAEAPPQRKTRGKERQHLVQEEVRAAVEETRSCKAVGMRHQGAWTRWENMIERKVTWTETWKAEPHLVKFLVQAVYDVLPSPSNLHT